MSASETKNYMIARFDEIEPTACPCGQARRAFAVPENTTATMHLVEISKDSKVHYHKKMTEIYFVLEGEGFAQIDRQHLFRMRRDIGVQPAWKDVRTGAKVQFACQIGKQILIDPLVSVRERR